ncbi:S-layer homology domain-containing protein [Paenibacillus xylanexedens]|uniref:S-layer homology domain-containing protein n=1 Tax=Paenibacillus xylanexedens TaxID=528191 RepID=UPI0016427348|nr:S-layer homology domain-containing protein [Paenibacillus xylanexedens]
MVYRKNKMHSLFTLPLAGLLFLLWGAQAAHAEQIDSLLPERSQQEIVQKWNQWMNGNDASPLYKETPSTSAPYSAGVVSDAYLEHGLNAANFYRFITGLQGDLVLDSTLNRQAQHGAVVVSTGGYLSHYPEQPGDMPKDFFDIGSKSASSSNLYLTSSAKNNVLTKSIQAYMNDSDASNIDRLGHRRWILSPQLQRIGFGLATRSEAGKTYDQYYSAMQVFDKSRTGSAPFNYSLFPNQGAFPIEAFGSTQAWSVQLNTNVFAEPSLSDVQVEMTRTSDQRTWTFNTNNQNSGFPTGYYNVDPADKQWFNQAYFNVETGGYGYGYAIIFRPDDVQMLKNGDTFNIRITGLQKKNGTAAEITYSTRFFHVDGVQDATLTRITPGQQNLNVRTGEQIDLPSITAVNNNGTSYVPQSNVSFTTTSDRIAIKDGKILGLQAGKAEIRIRFEGKEAVVSVTVTGIPQLTDIRTHWAKDAIQWAVQQEMVSGYEDGTFKPNNQVSEAEFLSMLFKLYANSHVLQSIDAVEGQAVKGNIWSDRYYTYASALNLNLEASKQNPKLRNHALNRTEVAVIVAGLGGKNYTQDEDAIRYLLNMGYSSGKTAATVQGYAGGESLTRAEAVVFLQNLKEKGFELWSRPKNATEATENEKNGGLPDQTMKAVYSDDHTLILQGTFPAYANQTMPIKIHGPSPAVEHIQTQQVTTDAYGNFKLTVSDLDAKELNLYVDVREDYSYWISVEAGRTAISDYTE